MVPLGLREHSHQSLHIGRVVGSVDKVNLRNRVESTGRPKTSLGGRGQAADLSIDDFIVGGCVLVVISSPGSIHLQRVLFAVGNNDRNWKVVQIERRRNLSFKSPVGGISAGLAVQASSSSVAGPDSVSVTVEISNSHNRQVISHDSSVVVFARSSRNCGCRNLSKFLADNFDPSGNTLSWCIGLASKRNVLIGNTRVEYTGVANLITGQVVEGSVVSPAVENWLNDISTEGSHDTTLVVSGDVRGVGSLPGNERALFTSGTLGIKVGGDNSSARLGPPGSHVPAVVSLGGIDGQTEVSHKCCEVLGSCSCTSVDLVALQATIDVDGRTEAEVNSSAGVSGVWLPESSDGVVHTGLGGLRHHVEPESGGDSQPTFVCDTLGVVQKDFLVIEHDS